MRKLLTRFSRSETAWGVCAGLLVGVVLLVLIVRPDFVRSHAPAFFKTPVTSSAGAQDGRGVNLAPRVVQWNQQDASSDVRYIADWIVDSRDASGLPFVIVDKKNARVYVFDANAKLRGASPVLLGSAVGDDTVAGIGSRPIDEVLPTERTTPAGRFVGERGYNTRGEDVVWVDYDAAVSMHRVLTAHPEEKRLERLASPTNDDKRISYGCINVPVAFFEAYLQPTFAGHRAIVYVLPEIKALDEVFGSYNVAEERGRNSALAQKSGG
ncbi:MAG TPA: hypothetical protein VK663_12415 [Burkholderiales bacterium]|nr:hypothetical protein [Burkholderiales bacterium]